VHSSDPQSWYASSDGTRHAEPNGGPPLSPQCIAKKKPFVQPYQLLGLFILGTFFAMMQGIEEVFAFTRGEADDAQEHWAWFMRLAKVSVDL
jgi:hypothetical protein